MSEQPQSAPVAAPAWYWHLPGLGVFSWWMLDLQVQWRGKVEYQFGWLVLALSLFMVWDRFERRPRVDRPTGAGCCALLGLAGAPLVLVAELAKNSTAPGDSASFVLSLGCALFLVANILYLYGPATLRHFLFPLLFLFVGVPLPAFLWTPVVLGLQAVITRLDVEALNALGIPAVARANVIDLPNCRVGIADACSGVRSLQSCVMAGLFLGQLMLKRTSLRVVCLAAGVGLALMGNFLRSLYLAVAAYRWGDKGVAGAHDAAGWSVLAFTVVGLLCLAWVLERLEKRADALAARASGGEKSLP